jgi:predicted RNA-binding Zn ribbon-like protein
MWTSITAEAIARLVDAGEHARLGTCTADACDRVFVDASRNGSRRFCSTACQNRVKTAAFRRRRARVGA